MSHDNRIFNVNGSGDEMLRDALRLAFAQEGKFGAKAWKFFPTHGLVLLWHHADGSNELPAAMHADDVMPLVTNWLKSKQAEQMLCEGWDADADHDGSNSRGWRVYAEDWGHVANNHYAICAIRPVFLWHGK